MVQCDPCMNDQSADNILYLQIVRVLAEEEDQASGKAWRKQFIGGPRQVMCTVFRTIRFSIHTHIKLFFTNFTETRISQAAGFYSVHYDIFCTTV